MLCGHDSFFLTEPKSGEAKVPNPLRLRGVFRKDNPSPN